MSRFNLVVAAAISSLLSTNTLAANEIKFGVEVDAVPYLLGGYYASASAAINNWQLRLITTKFETPDFYLQDGFEDNEIDVNALILDYYFDSNLQGFWIGAGFEQWDGEVVESLSKERKEYRSGLLTVGAGYAWYITDHFYINPWAGMHIPVAGADSVPFTNRTFDVKTTAEASVKLGFKF